MHQQTCYLPTGYLVTLHKQTVGDVGCFLKDLPTVDQFLTWGGGVDKNMAPNL